MANNQIARKIIFKSDIKMQKKKTVMQQTHKKEHCGRFLAKFILCTSINNKKREGNTKREESITTGQRASNMFIMITKYKIQNNMKHHGVYRVCTLYPWMVGTWGSRVPHQTGAKGAILLRLLHRLLGAFFSLLLARLEKQIHR